MCKTGNRSARSRCLSIMLFRAWHGKPCSESLQQPRHPAYSHRSSSKRQDELKKIATYTQAYAMTAFHTPPGFGVALTG